MKQQRVIRTPDFELIIPDGWDVFEEECEEHVLVLRSADGKAGLTLSTWQYKGHETPKEARDAFTGFVGIRRSAECETSTAMVWSDFEINQGDGFWYSKWAGRNESTGKRTATLVTLENMKLYALFVEALETTDEKLGELADEVFNTFEAK
jgi:hypothetical protein